MKVIEIKFTPWDTGYWFNPQDHKLEVGDFVVVNTKIGTEMGKISCFKEIDESKAEQEIKPILRKANLSDIEKKDVKYKNAKKDIKVCQEITNHHKLEIKIIDIHYSFDGGRITFAFTARGRVDFREAVKELTHHFQRSIRLHQIGVRDETKQCGGIGPCGEELCCQKFLRKLGQVNSELAECQQIIHRGSEKLSGLCGRLKCCLKFEQDMYEKLNSEMPALGDKVKTQKYY